MDEYSSQLHDVFVSCDTSGSGFLGRDDIGALCSKLQIDSYSDLLVQRLFDGQINDKVLKNNEYTPWLHWRDAAPW